MTNLHLSYHGLNLDYPTEDLPNLERLETLLGDYEKSELLLAGIEPPQPGGVLYYLGLSDSVKDKIQMENTIVTLTTYHLTDKEITVTCLRAPKTMMLTLLGPDRAEDRINALSRDISTVLNESYVEQQPGLQRESDHHIGSPNYSTRGGYGKNG